uniref:N-acetyl-D-glucosamine kinase n=1 Tax=Aegilops tauschii subsp. strangulata TaxID=200361 RepID=A0A453BN18_AEGTS
MCLFQGDFSEPCEAVRGERRGGGTGPSGTMGKLHGCVLIAGTGTIAYGFTSDGREARAAGAGPVLGDWGSGYGISAQALTAVVRAYDGRGPETVLTNNILDFLGLASPDELIGWTYEDQSWARIADILPVVVESAEAGDEVANKILHNSVGELASSVKAVVQRLALSGEDGKDLFPLVMVGKVLEANQRWDIGKEVISCVTKTYPGAYPIHPEVEPAVGAALLAWNAIASELDGDLRAAA